MSESNVNPPGASSESRANVVLIFLVVLFFAFNVATAWMFSTAPGNDWLEAIFLGAMVFQPIAMGLWTAFAGGSTLIKLTLAVPCLLLLIVATGLDHNGFTDIERSEAVALAITGLTIFAVSMLIFLILRWIKRMRLERQDGDPNAAASGFQFSIRFLLALTTLYAIVLAILVQLRFQSEPPRFNLFGPDFFIRILAVGGATFSAVVLPTMAVPLFILYGRAPWRILWKAVMFGAIITIAITVIWGSLAGEWDVLMYLFLVQLGAAAAGALSALMLRYGGFRLVTHSAAA